MRRFVTALLLMAGTLVPAISASAQTESGGVGIRLLEAPTARQNDPRALRSIVDHVKPGESFSRKFEVSNTTDGRRAISIYAAGADVKGGVFVVADGKTQNELSGWITIDTPSVDLDAGKSVQPRLTITVPRNAPEGERYAVVWAELPPRKPADGGIAVVNRVGLRVYLSVGAGGEPPTDFTIESLAAERDGESRPVVKAIVRNTGGRALDLSGNLKLTEGPGGLSAGPFDVRLGTTLAIGASEPVTVLLDKSLPPGPWQARIELRSSNTVRAASARLTFPEGADAKSTPVPAAPEKEDGGGSSTMLLVGGGLLLLMLVLLVVVFLLTRKKRPARDEEAPAAVTPPVAAAPEPATAPAPPAPAQADATPADVAPAAPAPARKPAAKRPAKPATKPATAPAEPAPVPGQAMPLDDVLSELATADGPRRDDLIGQAAAYGRDAIMASPLLPALPVDTARALGERVARGGR